MENQNNREKPDATDLDLPAFERGGSRPVQAQQQHYRPSAPVKHIPTEQRVRQPTRSAAPPLLASDVNRASPAASQFKKQAAQPQSKSYPGTIMQSAVQRHETGQFTAPAAQSQPYLSAATAQRQSVQVLTAEKPVIEPKVFKSAPASVTGILQSSIAQPVQPGSTRTAPSRPQVAQKPRQQVARTSEETEVAYYMPYVSVLGPHQGIIACVLICTVLISMLFLTPLGIPLGTYTGQAEWGTWWEETVVHNIANISPEKPSGMPRVQPMAAPLGENSIVGPPTVTVEEIESILRSYNSPAVGAARDFYNLGVDYGIDPAYAVAFFIHESSAGTNSGWAGIKADGTTTHNVGNIICAGYDTCYNRFRDYGSWAEGIEDWYKLLDREYINGRGAYTVEQIIPIYAPSFENNVPGYINAVNSLVNSWRQGAIP